MSNPYAAPDASLNSNKAIENISEFPRFSAWGVFFFMMFFGFIYYPVWFHKRTKVLNSITQRPISGVLTGIALVGYVAMILSLFFISGLASLALVGFISLTMTVVYIIWLYAFRNRLNELTGSKRGDKYFAGGIKTFFFTNIYLQYKINQIIDGER
ncbi:hypothetical protein H0A36_06150 [Endozoicomonas sp. SM1973]|uniref:DUF4234 domain-containing protein n=1 Tax=Spartinivicinus marinus TaxID=2994442 RepID=A0A853I7P7_9GAMM|nr:hypothetical protein [Spartinivicinus marinus]MCX4028252.1 hypothetical protein [Spartinivicinus marinus]NYZ65587.1 hypothetical protein [Spartinivicinus marinus]